MPEACADDRFDIIADYKRRLIEGTNIETRPEEMAVLDSILFRFWQMGWLREQIAQWIWDRPHHFKCSACGAVFGVGIIMYGYCPHCGREMGLEETERRKEWPEEVSGDVQP